MDLLRKDFVFLKVDDVIDLNGRKVAERLVHGRPVGVPFHAIFNDDQQLLIESIGTAGNIGAFSGFEGKQHLEKMLTAGRIALTDEDIHGLVDSIKN